MFFFTFFDCYYDKILSLRVSQITIRGMFRSSTLSTRMTFSEFLDYLWKVSLQSSRIICYVIFLDPTCIIAFFLILIKGLAQNFICICSVLILLTILLLNFDPTIIVLRFLLWQEVCCICPKIPLQYRE